MKFGTDQSGLTPAQLSQLRFNVSSNVYSARILDTGEVVPAGLVVARPSIAFSQQGNDLVLTWPSGWVLQSVTNVLGPYSDVSQPNMPYTIDPTLAPQQFFRLRQ